MNGREVLRRGDCGDAVNDLHQRLAGAGYPASGEEPASFGDATTAAVLAFQQARGLRVDGACGPETWGALIESSYRLGDRLLYRHRPMLRGDDVAELQRRLNSLGFDAGREDGIFGPHTEVSLRQFQLNAGLPADGVAGPASVRALDRLDALAGGSVASVREREALRAGPHDLVGRRIYLATGPTLGRLGEHVRIGLETAGAIALLDTSSGDDSELASAANLLDADLAIVLRTGDLPGPRCSFFATRTFRSEAGFLLAAKVEEQLAELLGPAGPPSGKAYGVLRETRMAALVCAPFSTGDADGMQAPASMVEKVAAAIVLGVSLWAASPLDALC